MPVAPIRPGTKTLGDLVGGAATGFDEWYKDPNNRNALDMGLGMAGPLGLGVAGTVRATTPKAKEVVEFVRRLWPSLGKAADKLPDIYASTIPGELLDSLPAASRSLAKKGFPGVGRDIEGAYGPEGVPGLILREELPAHQMLSTYLHEILHAIFRGKNAGKTPFDALEGQVGGASPIQTQSKLIAGINNRKARFGRYLDERTRDYYLDPMMDLAEALPGRTLQEMDALLPMAPKVRHAVAQGLHGGVEAMAENILRAKFPPPLEGRLPFEKRKWQGGRPPPVLPIGGGSDAADVIRSLFGRGPTK